MHTAYQRNFVQQHKAVTDIPQECQRSLSAMYAWPVHEHHPHILLLLYPPPLLGHLAMIRMAFLQGCHRKTQVA